MNIGREERIRIAREIVGKGVSRWIPDAQLRADLNTFVKTGSTDGLRDGRVGALIRRVQSLPPGQISQNEIQQIIQQNIAPIVSSFARDDASKNLINDALTNVPIGGDEAQLRQHAQNAVLKQMGNALNQLEGQNPEMAGLFMAAMNAPPGDKAGLRRSYEDYARKLPPNSPNRAEIEAYIAAGMPSPNEGRRFRAYLQQSTRVRNPHMSDAQINAEVERVMAMMPEERSMTWFDRLGQLPGGCAIVLVYLAVVSVMGVIMLGLLLALSSSVVLAQSTIGQAVSASLLFLSVGTGIYFWIRRQTRSTLHALRFFSLLGLIGAGIFFLISTETIDIQTLQDEVIANPERALFTAVTALSLTTTIFLWVRNLLNTVILLILVLAIGGLIAFGVFTGAIDLQAIFSSANEATGGFQ